VLACLEVARPASMRGSAGTSWPNTPARFLHPHFGWMHGPTGTGGSVGVPAADRPALFSLTAREQEVLALLAEGMTNVQLAEVLFISERTANRHVSNIFIKLGGHNRTQAARAAVAAWVAG
jgi:DNA-binding NarL/FixJ family response regulator